MKKLISIITCLAVILAMMPSMAFADANTVNAVSGAGEKENPYVIKSKEQFMTLVNIINAGQPEEDVIPSGTDVNDYAVFGVSDNYRTGWNKLNKSWYSVTCDITVYTEDRFYGVGKSGVPFNGYMDFNNHVFTYNNCVYTLDGDEGDFRLGVLGEVNTDTADWTEAFLNNIVTKGNITVNVPSDASFASMAVGPVIGRMTNAGIHPIGDIRNEADLVINIANSGNGKVNVGGIAGIGTRLRTVNTIGSLVNTGDITIHTLSADDKSSTICVGGIWGDRDGTIRALYCRSSGIIAIDNNVPQDINKANYTKDNSNKNIGGIAGCGAGWVYLENAVFDGEINVDTTAGSANALTDNIGGLAGISGATGEDGPYAFSVSAGKINVKNSDNNRTTNLGGIVGVFSSGKSNNKYLLDLNDIDYSVSGVINAGGILGKSAGTETYSNCYWIMRPGLVTEAVAVSANDMDLSSVYELDINSYNSEVKLPIIDYSEGAPNAAWYLKLNFKNWSSSDTSVATVKNNVFKAKELGNTVLSAQATIGFGEKDITVPVSVNVLVGPKHMTKETAIVNGIEDKYASSEAVTESFGDIAIYDGRDKLIKDTDYVITNNETDKKIVISFTGKYSGSIDYNYSLETGVPQVTAEGFVGIYDGKSHPVRVSSSTEGAEITYSDTIDGEYTAAIPEKTNAGKYKVYYKVSKDEKVASGELTISIAKAPLTITAHSKQIYTGNAVPELTYSVDGLFEGDTCSVPELSCGADGKIVGTYDISVSGADAGNNYVIEYVNGTLTVRNYTPPAQTDSVTNSDASTSAIVKPTEDAEGNITAALDQKTGEKLVAKAVGNNSTEVVIVATSSSNTSSKPIDTNAGNSAEIGIPEATVKAIAEKTDAAVTIKTDVAEATLDTAAVKAVADKAGVDGTVKLIVEVVKADADETVVNLKIETSKGTVSDFKDGNVKVTIAIDKALAEKKLVCVYIDDSDKYIKMDGTLNEDGTFTFTTGHFSTYAIMTEEAANSEISAQDIANATVTGIVNKTYTGSAITQNPVVTAGDKTLVNEKDYVVSCSNVSVGTAKVTITGKGKYEGQITKTFRINPKGTSITSAKGQKKAIKVTWKKQLAKMSKKGITGYQVQYSTTSSFRKGTYNTATVKFTTKVSSKTISKLKANKKYYVKVRTYKKVSGKNYYSGWSKVKTVRTK